MTNEGRRQIPERKRAKFRGRGKSHSFLRLPHFMLRSAEWAELSDIAVKLLLEVAMVYNGSNNGDIELTWDKLKLRGWRSKTTLYKARDELLEAAFLVCTRHGGRNRCSLYAITWEPIDACEGKDLELPAEKVASQAWQKRKLWSRNWTEQVQKMDQSGTPPFDSEPDRSRKWTSQPI